MSALRQYLRGGSRGQTTIEYVSLLGTCVVACLAVLIRYGSALGTDLRLTAEHLEGRGIPNLVDPLEALPAALARGDDDGDRDRGDGDDDDRRGGSDGALGFAADDDEKEEERICGVSGTYGELTKNALPNTPGDTYSLDEALKKREYKHKYERDHIPGKHALKMRARALTEGRIADELRSRCPKLDDDDLAALTANAVDRLNLEKAGNAIDNAGLTVVMPTEMHKKWSRTQGRKSTRTAPGDADNLALAEIDDIESYRLWLEDYLAKDSVRDDDETEFRDTRCAEQILAALDSFPIPKPGEDPKAFIDRRNAEYDRMLNDAVDGALGSSAIPDAVNATVRDTPLPDYCD
jgi:hypothetical protein